MITWSVDVLLGGSQVTPARCTQLTANAKYIWLSGKNGAGKSTLLDSITGVGDRPVQGSWRMSRADTVLAQPGLYHNIAYVSQRFDLVPQWSVCKKYSPDGARGRRRTKAHRRRVGFDRVEFTPMQIAFGRGG